MGKDLMFEDIYKAVKWAQQYPKSFNIEDDFKKIYITMTGIKKIELKPLGKKIIDDFIKSFPPKENMKNPEIKKIFGIPVVISEDVEGCELHGQ